MEDLLERYAGLEAYETDVGGVEYEIERPLDDEAVQALRAYAGGDLPPDLEQFVGRTRGVTGVGLDVQLPESPGRYRAKICHPIGEFLKVGGASDLWEWFIEPADQSCRVWWSSLHRMTAGLAGHSLREFFENHLDWVRRYKEATDVQIEAHEQGDYGKRPDGESPRVPPTIDREVEPVAVEAVSEDETLQKILERIPGVSRIFDFRGVETPAGFSLHTHDLAPDQLEQVGEVLVEVDTSTTAAEAAKRHQREIERKENLEFEDDEEVDFSPWWKFW